MLTFNRNILNIDLIDYEIVNNDIQATIRETGQKIRIKTFYISFYRPLIKRQISKFNISLPCILKTIGYYFPPEEDTELSTSITIKNDEFKYKIYSNGYLIIQEIPKYGDLAQLTSDYLKRSQKNIMNPTMRSKIIFGVAATLKKLHKRNLFGCFLANEFIFLDDKFEPLIGDFGVTNTIIDDKAMTMAIITGPPYGIPPEYLVDPESIKFQPSFDVFSFAFFLYRMFSIDISFIRIQKPGKSKYIRMITDGVRPIRPENIPDHYWDLIQECWTHDPDKRPSFDEIVEILKDEKFALEEFGEKTDMNKLAEYQTRIDSDIINDDDQKGKEILDLFTSKFEDKNQNCFIDEEDEKSHEMVAKIGEGATSFTYKVIDHRSNKLMCKKILKYQEDDQKAFKNIQSIVKEFDVLHKIQHPCICKSYGINTSEPMKDPNMVSKKEESEKTTISIFLEFLDHKLSDVLKSGINNTLKARIVIEIAHAMNFIHKHGLIHRDLKIENIMLNSVYEAKVVDFGLVRIHEIFDSDFSYVKESLTKGIGTLAYMSPEMLNEDEYDYSTDVYSFGVVLYVLFIGNLPKQNLKDKMNGKMIDLPSSSDSISQFCIDLIKECLQVEPSSRPSFEKILADIRKNDYFLASYIDKSVIYKRDHELELFEKYQK